MRPRRRSRRAKAARHARDAGERLGKLFGVLQHGLHVANAHAALQNKEAAQHGAEGIAEVIDQIRDGRDLARGGFRALGAALQLALIWSNSALARGA